MNSHFIEEMANELLANNMQISATVGELNNVASSCRVVGLHELANRLIGVIEAVNSVINRSDEYLILMGAKDD